MVKKLVMIVALLCCQLNAGERQSYRIAYTCKEGFDRAYTMISDPNAELDEYFTRCSRRSILPAEGNWWRVIAASPPIKAPWSVKFNVTVESARTGLRRYFIKEGNALGILTQSYRAQTLSDSTWDSIKGRLVESKHYDINRYSDLCLTELPKESLTSLSKGLIAATAVGLGIAAYYAYTRKCLTRNAPGDKILQEQNDRAQLPENQNSQIVS